MRQKIKQMLNKENGFTLVELLAVIVILGIIVAIAIPAVGSVIDRADSDADDAEIALIEDAARLYITSGHKELEPRWGLATKLGDKQQIKIPIGEVSGASDPSLSSLYDKGFLEDRADEKPLTGYVTVIRSPIEGESKGYTYEYEVDIKKTE